MPLPLDDSLWSELHSSYNGTEEVVSWLSEAYEQGGFSDERLGDLINEIMHQGGDSDAMYAVAPHLIELARKAEPREAINLLSHAGHIYMSAGSPNAIPCPEFLHDDFVRYGLEEGAKLLSPLLRLAATLNPTKQPSLPLLA